MRPVIAVSGPVGAGKSSLVRGLAQQLDGAALHFDDYELRSAARARDLRKWMDSGASYDDFTVPRLCGDLEALRRGEAITVPRTGATVRPGRHVFFETPFGREHAETARYVDLLVWIETPLDVALARKLRQSISSPPVQQGARLDWLDEYLDNYVGVMSELIRMQSERVRAAAELVVDGRKAPAALLKETAAALSTRLP